MASDCADQLTFSILFMFCLIFFRRNIRRLYRVSFFALATFTHAAFCKPNRDVSTDADPRHPKHTTYHRTCQPKSNSEVQFDPMKRARDTDEQARRPNIYQERKDRDRKLEEANPVSQRLLVSDLPGDLRAIYGRTIKNLVPNVKLVAPVPKEDKADKNEGKDAFTGIGVTQEVDGAMLVLTVSTKGEAEQLFSRLQNAKVFGRRLKCEYHPLSTTVSNFDSATFAKEVASTKSTRGQQAPTIASQMLAAKFTQKPTLLSIRTSQKAQSISVHRQLNSMKGFLGLEPVVEKGALPDDLQHQNFVATFADEGSALHARALLSGRPIGVTEAAGDGIGFGELSNIHMFIQLIQK